MKRTEEDVRKEEFMIGCFCGILIGIELSILFIVIFII